MIEFMFSLLCIVNFTFFVDSGGGGGGGGDELSLRFLLFLLYGLYGVFR